jgi:hypothetical protein
VTCELDPGSDASTWRDLLTGRTYEMKRLSSPLMLTLGPHEFVWLKP